MVCSPRWRTSIAIFTAWSGQRCAQCQSAREVCHGNGPDARAAAVAMLPHVVRCTRRSFADSLRSTGPASQSGHSLKHTRASTRAAETGPKLLLSLLQCSLSPSTQSWPRGRWTTSEWCALLRGRIKSPGNPTTRLVSSSVGSWGERSTTTSPRWYAYCRTLHLSSRTASFVSLPRELKVGCMERPPTSLTVPT